MQSMFHHILQRRSTVYDVSPALRHLREWLELDPLLACALL